MYNLCIMFCYYCGCTATCKDHVVPYSFLTMRKRTHSNLSIGEVVDACTECNLFLSTHLFDTMDKRCDYLLKQYKKRYKGLLKSPDWTDNDIAELGFNLRATILADMKLKKLVQLKIRTLNLNIKTLTR